MATRGQYGRGEGKGERRDEGRSAPIYTWRRVLRAVTVNWSLVFEGHRRSVLGVLVGVRKQGEWRKKCLGTRPLSQAPVSHPPLARLSRGAPSLPAPASQMHHPISSFWDAITGSDATAPLPRIATCDPTVRPGSLLPQAQLLVREHRQHVPRPQEQHGSPHVSALMRRTAHRS